MHSVAASITTADIIRSSQLEAPVSRCFEIQALSYQPSLASLEGDLLKYGEPVTVLKSRRTKYQRARAQRRDEA
jgi:hypothetical protein